MKILQVIPSLSPLTGGPVERVRQESLALVAKGNVVEVVSLDSPDEPWLAEFPVQAHAVGPGVGFYGYTQRLVPWLAAHANRFDLVVVHGLWQYAGLGTWRALRHGPPYVVFAHGMLDPYFRIEYPLKHIKKCVYWLLAEHRVLGDARAVLFTCEEERRLARKAFWPYRLREQVVPFGTTAPPDEPEAQRAAFAARFPELQGKNLLIFLGRIHPKKGCDLLLEAFAATQTEHDLHLVMAGPDQVGWQVTLQQQAERVGIADRITWTGMLEGDLKWGALRAARVFSLPSHQENFGISVAEAMACEVPVLISHAVNIWPEIVADGAGLAGPDDTEGTVATLRAWLALSEDVRKTMRANAKQCFQRRFDIEVSIGEFASVLAGPRNA